MSKVIEIPMLPREQWPDSYEAACEQRGYDAVKILPDFSVCPPQHQKAFTSLFKLVIIAEAINNGYVFDFTDGSWKYWPVFLMGSPSGVCFSFFDYADWGTRSSVGARLSFRNREEAIYFGKQFIDLHRDWHMQEALEFDKAVSDGTV